MLIRSVVNALNWLVQFAARPVKLYKYKEMFSVHFLKQDFNVIGGPHYLGCDAVTFGR